jgi:hypothetical protein
MLSKIGGFSNPAPPLQHLPSLIELAIGELEDDMTFADKHEGIRHLVLSECFYDSIRSCLVSAYEKFPSFSELTLYAYELPHLISLMEDNAEWILKRITSLSLVRAEYDPVDRSPVTNSQCKVALGYFPNLVRLSLGCLSMRWTPEFSYERDSAEMIPACQARKLSGIRSFIEVITEANTNSEAPHLDKLDLLELVDIHLDREVLSRLARCLQNPQFVRSGSRGQSEGCRIFLRICYGGSDCVPIPTRVVSVSELHHLTSLGDA